MLIYRILIEFVSAEAAKAIQQAEKKLYFKTFMLNPIKVNISFNLMPGTSDTPYPITCRQNRFNFLDNLY
jgi:hypothetical protein